MNRNDLYRSFNAVDDDILERSEIDYNTKKRPVCIKLGVLAACLCLMISGIWVTWKTNELENISKNSQEIVQTVILNDEYYHICGEGETKILQECGLPTEISSDLAGNHITYLIFDGNHSYTVSDNQTDIELFSYAPKSNSNIYIVKIYQKYYAAIRHDHNGYHGLK